jgi:hypothetical protein
MTTLEFKTDLQNKIKNKSDKDLIEIYENNQNRLNSGSDLEDGLTINDVVIEEMKKRLNIINVIDSEVYNLLKNSIINN